MSDATATTNGVKVNKFDGDGVPFKAKLIGMEDLSIDRDEKVCLDSMIKLKAMVRVRGEHKQKLQLNLTMNGIKVYDDTTKVQIASHEVERVSFVVLDPRDQRAFGYVYNTSDDRHQFWAIKTERQAALTVLAMKELFETAFEEFTKSEKAKAQVNQTTVSTNVTGSTQVQQSVFPTVPALSSPVTSSPPVAPVGEILWGDEPAIPSFPPVPPVQTSQQLPPQQSVPAGDLWGMDDPVIPPTQPPSDSLSDLFDSLGPPPPPPVTTTAVPRIPTIPTMPTVPSIPVTNQQAPTTAPTTDIFSMFASPAPTSNVNNSMFVQSPPRPSTIAQPQQQQQQQLQQSNLLFSSPTPAFVPQQQQQPNLLFSTPAPVIVPQQQTLQQPNLLFSTPAPAIVPQQQQNLLFSTPLPTPTLLNQQQPSQPNLLMSTPAPAVIPPTATKPVDEFDLLGAFS
ncbi:hypothetical protein I4U23_029826 [Adineta vaga]|nr:hypothetical protein I4U23_029826 [Adineta vaga]